MGLLSAAVAVGVGELVAAFVRPAAAPVIAVGNKFILLTPGWLKNFALNTFGTKDKTALLIGIYVVIAALAVLVGTVALRRLLAGVAGLLLFGAVGVYSAATADAHRAADPLPTVIATIAAVGVLTYLVRVVNGERGHVPHSSAPSSAGELLRQEPDPWPAPIRDRRRFLVGAAVVAGGAAVAGIGGEELQRVRFSADASRATVRLPAPTDVPPPPPRRPPLPSPRVPPPDFDAGDSFATSNANFYRVDTAFTVPQLDAATWRLRIHGMVDRPMSVSFDDLLHRPLVERWITLICVSNDVGGDLTGTARFRGVRLADLLRAAGVQYGADQIVARSADGMTIGSPTAVLLDGRDAMLAVGMNGEPLPIKHGFPVRMVVPGLYGYVSACKWITEIEATTFASYDTYWVRRGWAAQAPIRMESRIDTPMGGASLRIGRTVQVAGVAWHQHVGISRVEVQVDDGPWTAARIGPVPSADTWRQWVLPWRPKRPGTHRLRVRAVDAHGQLQEATVRSPFPSGASGWHTVEVTAG